MNNHIVQYDSQSPFDRIKQADDHGNEYWSARDLMEIMGYPTWQHFMPVINRAWNSAAAQGHSIENLFKVNREKSGGRPRDDYWMPRFACYLVAMNGDPRKKEVADAQAYFAIQTHVAETQAPQQLTDDQIMHQALEISSRRIAALEPKAEAWDTLAGAKGDYSVAEAAQLLSRDDQLSIGRNRLFNVMGEMGWLYRWGKRQSWRAYQDQVDNGRIVLRMAAAFQNQKTGEMERPAPTIRLTARGVDAVRTYLLKQVAA